MRQSNPTVSTCIAALSCGAFGSEAFADVLYDNGLDFQGGASHLSARLRRCDPSPKLIMITDQILSNWDDALTADTDGHFTSPIESEALLQTIARMLANLVGVRKLPGLQWLRIETNPGRIPNDLAIIEHLQYGVRIDIQSVLEPSCHRLINDMITQGFSTVVWCGVWIWMW